jgi:Spy/CpxP family protein refolding chaperone
MANDRKLKSYALIIVTFLLGVATGGGASYASMEHRYARMFRDRPELENRRLGALARRLDLDESQRDRVHAVMERYSADRRALTRDMFERCGEKIKAAQDALDNDIRRTLRPDQMARYETLVKERREHFGFGRP